MRPAGLALIVVIALGGCAPSPPAAPTLTDSPTPPPVETPSPSPTPVAYGAPEYRAMWVDAFHDGIKSPAQVEKLVADARRGNLNALFVQVRKRADAYFNRADEPRAVDIAASRGFDPLAYLIKLAHASTPRIEVHAWLNTFFVGETSGVYRAHPDWVNRTNDGSTGGYLDPGIPGVQAYTRKVFVDLARNYDVDGLHMDFVRYPGVTWGYSAAAIALYMRDTGAISVPAPDDSGWQAWRRDRVTAFVRDLHNDLRAARPAVKLSGALICFGGGPATAADWSLTSAYSSVFQDWLQWMLKGYIDFGVPMNYDSDWIRRERNWFDQWLLFEKDSGFANRVITGVGVFLNYPEDSLAQIRRALAPSARGNHVLGVALYSYASTSVYGTADFYDSPDLSGGLPRQPYAGSIAGEPGLVRRADLLNDWFMTQLSQPAYYSDVQLGRVHTQPVFTMPAQPPALPS
ncbi:MAG: glycoside hydrolase family 10 protein [Candidatus Dormibacteraceae bacterium]